MFICNIHFRHQWVYLHVEWYISTWCGCCDCKAAIFELTHKRLSELIKTAKLLTRPLTCLSVIICGHYEVTLWRFSATNMKMIFFTDFMYMAAYYRQNLPIAIYSLYRLQPPLSKKKKKKMQRMPPPPQVISMVAERAQCTADRKKNPAN